MTPQPPPVVSAKTSGLAITSFVLGILSFFCFGFLTGIPAIILGVAALSKINKSAGRQRGTGVAIGGICTGGVGLIVGTAMMAAMLLPAFAGMREKGRRTQCMSNLRQMGIASHNYAVDHDLHLPRTLDDLLAYGITTNMLVCPSAKDRTRCSYELLPVKFGGEAVDTVLIREIEPNHGGRRNQLYMDGHAAISR
jgi:prepilin-type processing-associated H-X9-DG protein